MRYTLSGGFVVQGEETPGILIDIAEMQEKKALCAQKPELAEALQAATRQNHSFIKVLEGAVFAALRLPDVNEHPGMCLWVSADHLIVLVRGVAREKALERVLLGKSTRKLTLPMCAQRMLAALAQYDATMLEEIETSISVLEERVLAGQRLDEFARDMSLPRKRLMRLHSYYERLGDVAEVLSQNENDLFPQGELSPFRQLLGSMGRFSGNTGALREYAMQVQEIYQSQVDIQQNNIMRVLTVITTIVLPLSLITSWYGMNFVGMPELGWEHGYAMVVGLGAAIVGGTIWYFRKKKYM